MGADPVQLVFDGFNRAVYSARGMEADANASRLAVILGEAGGVAGGSKGLIWGTKQGIQAFEGLLGKEGADSLLSHLSANRDAGRPAEIWMAAGREPFGLVGGHGHAVSGEEGIQCGGEGAHRASGTAGAFEQGLRVVGLLVQEKLSQRGDHRAGAADAALGGEIGGEVTQPVRRLSEFGDRPWTRTKGRSR